MQAKALDTQDKRTSEIAAAVQAGKADILRLWAAVERFAWQQALRWTRAMEGRAGVEENDLLQVAFIALMDTLPTWDVNKGEFLTLYGIKLRTTRAALKLHDAEAIFNEVSARVWDNFKATRRTIRAELEQAVRAANIANPDAIDNNALELMKTGVLSSADYSAFMERFDSNHTMLKLVGHYAAEAAKTTDSRREAAALNAIALDCQSGEGAVMRAWDSISAISDSCGDGDGYRRKSPGVIVSMSEKWDDLAGEAVENF